MAGGVLSLSLLILLTLSLGCRESFSDGECITGRFATCGSGQTATCVTPTCVNGITMIEPPLCDGDDPSISRYGQPYCEGGAEMCWSSEELADLCED